MNDWTCVSLFSGIGGLDLGLHRAGFRHLAFCESDAYRRDVLAARWPGVPVHDDVRAFGEPARGAAADRLRAPTDLGRRQAGAGLSGDLDLLCGGFPCQDLSVAGQRKGLDGDRSGLFFEYARIAESLRPRWLLVENVPGLLSSNGGRDFGTVLGTLADIGYGMAWRTLDSRFFGVPQRRRRVFVLGAVAVGDPRAAAERAGQILAVGTRCQGHPATRGETGPDVAVASLSGLGTGGPDDNDGQGGRLVAFAAKGGGGGSYREDGLAPTLSAHGDDEGGQPPAIAFAVSENQRGELLETNYAHQLTSGGGKPGQGYPAVREGASVRRLMPVECERLQALPDQWTQLGDTADSKRYAALGDAVTATVSEWIGRRLANA